MSQTEPETTTPAPLPGEPGFKAPLTEKQLKRANQTLKGMIISVALTFAIALPVVFLNPGSSKQTYQNRIDVAAIAQQTVTTAGFDAISPEFPEGWYANAATWNPGAADGVAFWQLGIVKDDTHYAQVLQTDQANASWISLATNGSIPMNQKVTIDGTSWERRVLPRSEDGKDLLTTKMKGYTFVITVDQGDDEFLTETARLVQRTAAQG